ncbi:hypothetical protein [Chryseobacterium glaciei]|nr:hypothetical protein [Chryseobacterium glaciei]
MISIGALVFGQVGVGTPNPSPSAMLEVFSIDKGFLPPRLTIAQRDGINPKPAGSWIYNTDDNCMEYWNGTSWIGNDCTVIPVVPPPDLSLSPTGFRIPYTVSNGTATGTVDGLLVTAKFRNYGDVEKPSGSVTNCGVTASNFRFSGSHTIIDFNREVTNFKVLQAGSNSGNKFSFVLTKGGVKVSPVISVAPNGGCNNNFTIDDATTNITVSTSIGTSGIVYNFGGVWFDSIAITDSGIGTQLSQFTISIGNAQ